MTDEDHLVLDTETSRKVKVYQNNIAGEEGYGILSKLKHFRNSAKTNLSTNCIGLVLSLTLGVLKLE